MDGPRAPRNPDEVLPPRRPVIELVPPAGRAPARAVPRPPPRPRWARAVILLALTFLATTTLGPVWLLWAHPTRAVGPEIGPWMSPRVLALVWGEPALLAQGLAFSLSGLFILLCHEMGHYLACRAYRLPATLPYFLPLPLGLGTLGAFIRIRAPIRSRRQLFDVGVAGPLAGFLALLPFLVLGVAWSEPARVELVAEEALARLAPDQQPALLPTLGRCLALRLTTLLVHGPLPDDVVLHLHPFALAAWFGLLVTALNLLPLAQLDGGHILYAVAGPLQRRLAWPLWIALVAAGFLFWFGWWLWCLIVLFLGLKHPPVPAHRPLGPLRTALAWAALVVFMLSFMPMPLEILYVKP